MERLEQSHQVKIRWRSYELRPEGTEIPEAYKQKILAGRPQFEAMAKENYGVVINSGPFGIDSRPALIGAKYAEWLGAEMGETFHNNVMKAYWKDARDISDIDVLTEIAVASGMDEMGFLDAIKAEAFDSQVSADVQFAFQNGISGVPGLVFANKYLVSGAQPYETLVAVTEKVQAEQKA